MKPTTFDLTRLWCLITGLALAVIYFIALWLDVATPPMLPLLVGGIGGFELLLFIQDVMLRRGANHG